jgi:PAS domain S-box-containing protein
MQVAELRGYAMFMIDPHGVLASWNAGVEQLIGYSENEWIGRPASIIFTPEEKAAEVCESEGRAGAIETKEAARSAPAAAAAEGMKRTRAAPVTPTQNRLDLFFRNLGAGLITGCADDDPSGISTYSVHTASG